MRDMSEYEFPSTRNCSHTEYEWKLFTRDGKANGHHHHCPYQDNHVCEHFVSNHIHIEFSGATAPIEPHQDPDRAPLISIHSGIFEVYIPLPFVQNRIEVSKEGMARLYHHCKQHKREHSTNCNDYYCKTHDRRLLKRKTCSHYNVTTCSACRKPGHGLKTCDIEGLILQKKIHELIKESGNN